MTKRRLLAWIWAAAAGCSPTEIVLVVHSDLQAPQEIDAVEITTAGGGGPAQPIRVDLTDPSAPDFPLTLGIRAGGDRSSLDVEVVALRGTARVVVQRARTGFVRGEARVLTMHLLYNCRSKVCAPVESCGPAGCRPEEIPAQDLPPWSGRVSPPTLVARELPDAAEGVDAPPPPEILLEDDFNDGIMDVTRWTIGVGKADPAASTSDNMKVQEREGALQIEPQADRSNRYRGYLSVRSYDVRGATAEVELLELTQNGGQMVFGLDAPGVSYVFRVRWDSVFKKNQLLFQDTTPNSVPEFISLRFASHRFWRFRHDPEEGVLHWETSGTAGGGWTSQRSIPVIAAALEQAHIAIYAGTRDAQSSSPGPGVARFDNFRLGRARK